MKKINTNYLNHMRSGDMSDWLIVLLILLAMPLTLFIIFAIILFIDNLQWKLKEKNNEDNELQTSSEDDIPWYTKIDTNNKFELAKYEREGMTLKAYKEKYYPLFIEGIKDPELETILDDIAKENITCDKLDKIARDTNIIRGQFEDWHIPGQQKDE